MKQGEKDRIKDPGKGMQEVDPFVIARWIAASLAGKLPEEDEEKLSAWRASSDRNKRLYGRVADEENRKRKRERFDSFDKEIGWAGYRRKQRRERSGSGRWGRWVRYAAVLLVPLCVALYVWKGKTVDKPVLPVIADHSITPGGAKALLFLSTGDVVDLAATSGNIRGDGGLVIQNNENRLSYQDTGKVSRVDDVRYNEVFVPKGGEYQLVLSDGTLVYLNSMTRLRYPVKFSGDIRDVALDGEAYFEVARDEKKPFVVKTGCYDVTVLGTRFNITAYQDEMFSSTTLVQGAVVVSGEGMVGSRRLRVDDRFVLNKATGDARVEKVDVSYDTAWKDGKFRFRDVRLEDIMRLVERWYDVTIEYDDDEVKDFRFGFNMSRHETIDPLLRVFELNGKVKIERNGKVLKIKRGR